VQSHVYIQSGGPKKWYPGFHFAITSRKCIPILTIFTARTRNSWRIRLRLLPHRYSVTAIPIVKHLLLILNTMLHFRMCNVLKYTQNSCVAYLFPQIVHCRFFLISHPPHQILATPLRTGLPGLLSVRKRDALCGRYVCGRYRRVADVVVSRIVYACHVPPLVFSVYTTVLMHHVTPVWTIRGDDI